MQHDDEASVPETPTMDEPEAEVDTESVAEERVPSEPCRPAKTRPVHAHLHVPNPPQFTSTPSNSPSRPQPANLRFLPLLPTFLPLQSSCQPQSLTLDSQPPTRARCGVEFHYQAGGGGKWWCDTDAIPPPPCRPAMCGTMRCTNAMQRRARMQTRA